MYPRHRHKSSSASMQKALSSSSSVPTIASLESKKKVKKYLKLIELYKDHECLWNECNKDFFNFELKEQVWEFIARKMKRDSDPNEWKYLIHKLRYNVQREKIHEQEARFNNTVNKLRPKLSYSDKFQFLNHMFDRKRVAGESIPSTSLRNLAARASGSIGSGGGQRQESLTIRYSRTKKKTTPLHSHKLKALQSLRDSYSNNFIFTPEAFRKVTQIISNYTGASK
ncbi:uncharacterized protein [Drosophila tropicalis]|uniref:uncharacterized protein n=1 Tax=Drosophila tropicalis TaxID=46794 RepID=UPI0035ABDB79